jgi:hypothetical protein
LSPRRRFGVPRHDDPIATTFARGSTRSIRPDYHRSSMRCRPSFAVVLFALASLAAQEVPPIGPPLPAPPPSAAELRVLDFVAATVGDKAILASHVTEQWRAALAEDDKRPPALRKYGPPGAASKRHALWRQLLEQLVGRELTAQSARLLGKSPNEVEEQVERLVQDELRRTAEERGGLNAYARELNVVGQSMGTVADDLRTSILSQMAQYQGVMRDLRDQRALLATPREMKARFDANPTRFERPGSVQLAVSRYALERGAEAAAREAAATAAAWNALPRPVTEAQMRGLGAQVLGVSLKEAGVPAMRGFIPTCKPGEVSAPVTDDAYVWVMLCLTRTEPAAANFADGEVQDRLRKELEAERLEAIATAMFQESRVGVTRLPWGDPGAMERSRRGTAPMPPRR